MGTLLTVWDCGVDCAVLDQRENTALLDKYSTVRNASHLWPLKGVQYVNKSIVFTLKCNK